MKMQKIKWGVRVSGWGVRVDVIEELKFLRKFRNKYFEGESGGGSGWWGSGWM